MKNLGILVLMMGAFASAQSAPRHFDFTQVLVGIDGKPLQNGDARTTAPLTLGDAAVNALESQTPDDLKSSGADKFKLDELARKVYRNSDVTLSVEEIAAIKERIGKVYGPMVVGAAWRILDPGQK
ncbi:MAG: hypothetical protein ABR910_14905 [Acidobacteriaceae bacterium]|jgi:hypothetical protein